MRILETILKLLFLSGSIYSIKSEVVPIQFLSVYLLITLILGIVLIFNKQSSYNYPQTKRDFVIRRIEGGLLIIFSLFVAYAQLF
jgi:Ca2+/Na+ antiporter